MNSLLDVHDRLEELHKLNRKLADEARRADQGGLAANRDADADQFEKMASIVLRAWNQLTILLKF